MTKKEVLRKIAEVGLVPVVRAQSADEAMKVVEEHPVRVPRADVPEPGRRRKRRRAGVPAMRGAKVAVAED